MDRNIITKLIGYILSIIPLLALLLPGCSGYKPSLDPEGPYWVDNDRKDIPEPKYYDPNLAWLYIERSLFDQVEEGLDLERNFRILGGKREEAANINCVDEVPNSTWFTNRHGANAMTPEAIMKGVDITPGPDTTGPWLVFRPKTQGKTPGFWIEDSQGYQYVIKFDPEGYPEMATAAPAIASRYFHACGYNVPQETIVYYRPEILKVKDGVTFVDSRGVKREFTEADLMEILARIQHQPDGRIRSMASLSLGTYGKIKGPFEFEGRRKDDPNDWFDHQNRRELRGLYVIGSFINHYDLKDHNTLDIYVDENGNHFLKHFLIDFGSTFGSDGQYPKEAVKGYANLIDVRDGLVSFFTLGLKDWAWKQGGEIKYPSIGYFESDIFEPNKFDPIYPNPAFENMTDRDAYWGAKIVMAFRDDDLEALIDAGELSDPEARKYLFQMLKKRRDKIGRFWFSRVNPLDNFQASYNGEDLYIDFQDLGIIYGLWPDDARYEYELRDEDNNLIKKGQVQECKVVFFADDLRRMVSYFKPSPKRSDFKCKLDIITMRGDARPSKPTRMHLRYDENKDQFMLSGVEHLD